MAESLEYKNLKKLLIVLEKAAKLFPEKDNMTKTIPSVFNKTYDENFLSDYIVYILDPLQNGVGLEPLIRVIEEYSEKDVNVLQNLT